MSSTNRRSVMALALALTVPASRTGAATGDARVRVGWVTAQRAESLAPYVAAFRVALAQFGLVEERNVVIDFRYGDDQLERVPALVDELVQSGVRVIVAQGAAVAIIDRLKPKVPVVYVTSADPVASGFADTLAKPHANMTGLTFMSVELHRKRLELLREVIPGLRTVAILANPEHPGEGHERAFALEVGRNLGMEITPFATRKADDLDAAFSTLARDPPHAISLFSDGFAVQNRQRIIDAATRMRVPVVAAWAVFADSGALFSYGPRLIDSYRRLAYYVDRILKGAMPSELPIERPDTFEFVLNQKVGDVLGLKIPNSLLIRADRMIS